MTTVNETLVLPALLMLQSYRLPYWLNRGAPDLHPHVVKLFSGIDLRHFMEHVSRVEIPHTCAASGPPERPCSCSAGGPGLRVRLRDLPVVRRARRLLPRVQAHQIQRGVLLRLQLVYQQRGQGELVSHLPRRKGCRQAGRQGGMQQFA